uniref:SUN domain-containing protein n=1 Tax=Heligmosomoides polygyrus TaxID=6339 RepID=A0A183GN98_HELPZ
LDKALPVDAKEFSVASAGPYAYSVAGCRVASLAPRQKWQRGGSALSGSVQIKVTSNHPQAIEDDKAVEVSGLK